MAREVIATDPGARHQTILKRAKALVLTEGVEGQLDHAKSLTKQGQLHELVNDEAATLWSEVVQKLPPEGFKFTLNAAQDTLPHNPNLSVWRRGEGLSGQCKLCSQRQTLLHILNHCQVVLGLRRFNIRHDNMLKIIFDQLQHQCAQEFQIAADLPGSTYSFPSFVASTDMHPDIVMWSNAKQVMILVELTVCFETNLVDASLRKAKSIYQNLHEACTANGYSTSLVTLEVRSRGFLNIHGFQKLFEHFPLSKEEKISLLKYVTKEAILGSQRIWTARNRAIN